MTGQGDVGHREGRRVGRRAGDSGTKETILSTALEMFADSGYEATSVRAIAREAGVDPGLIRHFFGTKQELFAAAVVDRSTISGKLLEALEGPDEQLGERLVRTYLGLWESPETGPVLQTLFRSAVASEDLAPLFVETMLAHIRDRSAGSRTALRLTKLPLVAPQIVGVVVCRYVLRIPALAEEPLDSLVARLAPVVQQELVG